VMAVYLHVLVNASNAEERGVTEHLNEEDIASALDIETEAVAAILAAMQARVMDGARVMGWDKRQPLREDGSAQRAAAYRDRQKLAKQTPDEPLQTQFPQSERNRTQPNAREEKRREEKRREECVGSSTRQRPIQTCPRLTPGTHPFFLKSTAKSSPPSAPT